MQSSDNVLQLAKERARFGFAAIVQQAMFDAEARIDHAAVEARGLLRRLERDRVLRGAFRAEIVHN